MKSTQEIVMSYARRIEELEEKASALAAENEALKKMLQEARHNGASGSSTILNEGKEKDFYPSERHEILVDVLQEARKGLKNGSRRADVIDDLLAANPVSGEPKKRASQVKVILKGYRGMDEGIRKKLRALGITGNEQHRKHFLLTYFDDPRYTVTMTATGSDSGRGGKNLAGDMVRLFF